MSVLYCVSGLKKVDVGKKIKEMEKKSGERRWPIGSQKCNLDDAAGKQKINFW